MWKYGERKKCTFNRKKENLSVKTELNRYSKTAHKEWMSSCGSGSCDWSLTGVNGQQPGRGGPAAQKHPLSSPPYYSFKRPRGSSHCFHAMIQNGCTKQALMRESAITVISDAWFIAPQPLNKRDEAREHISIIITAGNTFSESVRTLNQKSETVPLFLILALPESVNTG